MYINVDVVYRYVGIYPIYLLAIGFAPFFWNFFFFFFLQAGWLVVHVREVWAASCVPVSSREMSKFGQ